MSLASIPAVAFAWPPPLQQAALTVPAQVVSQSRYRIVTHGRGNPTSYASGAEMKVIYEVQVRAQCPVNPSDTDLYDFTIEAEAMIEVEKIVAFFAEHAGRQKVFQETLTQACAVALGCRVHSVGWHSGIRVTCEAP
jgi:hypothetical protein